MGLFSGVISVLKILIVIAIAVAILLFVYYKFFRKSASKIKVDTNEKTGKLRDCAEFIPVESISGSTYKVKGENRFLASINCKGFDYFSSSVEEKLRTQEGYLNFVNIIQNPITLRIDSSAVDLSAPISRHTEIYNKKFIEQGMLYDQFTHYVKLFRNAKSDAERALYQNTLSEIKRQLDTNEWKMQHIEHLINYQKTMSGRQASPIQEERYIFDWQFNPQDFPAGITEAEILERAEKELDKREQRLRHALSAANVKVQRDSEADLFNLFYRHFHPWSADTFKTLSDSNSDERIVSGKRSFDRAKRNYEEALASEDIIKMMKEEEAKNAVSGQEQDEAVSDPTFYLDEEEPELTDEQLAEITRKNREVLKQYDLEQAQEKTENASKSTGDTESYTYEITDEGGVIL